MKTLKVFVSATLAGLCIGLGGLVFLMTENKAVGAAVFTVGLFTICCMGFHLFTGKMAYVFQNDKAYALTLPIIWLGNLAGTGITAGLAMLSRNAPALQAKAEALCAVKTGDSLVSLFCLGVLCNIFIYIAVELYNRNPHEVGKYLALFLGVMGFILAGTEHCVADMFYFWVAGWSGKAVVALLVITLGNSVGGVLVPVCRAMMSARSA